MNPYEKEAEIEFRGEYYVTASRFISIRRQLEAENARLKEELARLEAMYDEINESCVWQKFSKLTTLKERLTETYNAQSLDAENLRKELAAAQKDAERKIETAWRDGYGSRVTYNDHEVSDEATCWIESTTFAAIAAEKGEKK